MISARGSRPLRVIRESFDFSGLSENPLSLSGRITQGDDVGLDWKNTKSMSGRGVVGTFSQSTPPYEDSICTIAPPSGLTWSPNQELISKVFCQNRGTFGGYHETEHLHRFKISANSARGFEVIFSFGPTNYIEIAHWLGPLHNPPTTTGVISLANSNVATAPTIDNNHYCRSKIVGNWIFAWHKVNLGDAWTLYAQTDISQSIADPTKRWGDGDIGMGNWDNGSPGNFDDYGILTLDVTA